MTPAKTRMTNGQQFTCIRQNWLRMSQSELSEALNCSRNIISRVELDQTEYKLSHLQALQRLCGNLSINTLLMLPDPNKASWLIDYTALNAQKRSAFDAMAREAIKLAK